MTSNSYYNYHCTSLGRNCVSGCCKQDGSCANAPQQCYYRYGDYQNNTNYHFPLAQGINMLFHLKCQWNGINCKSGCCNILGYCSHYTGDCVYKYLDYQINSNYYYPGPIPTAHASCNIKGLACTSGCCTSSGGCAYIEQQCVNKYSDYDTNPYYYFDGLANVYCNEFGQNCRSGCCDSKGFCAYYKQQCMYKYKDFNASNKYKIDQQCYYNYGIGGYCIRYNLNYNYKCNNGSKNCFSGCCTQQGNCALYDDQCKYLYYDYKDNDRYFFRSIPSYEGYFTFIVTGFIVILVLFWLWAVYCSLRKNSNENNNKDDNINEDNQLNNTKQKQKKLNIKQNNNQININNNKLNKFQSQSYIMQRQYNRQLDII